MQNVCAKCKMSVSPLDVFVKLCVSVTSDKMYRPITKSIGLLLDVPLHRHVKIPATGSPCLKEKTLYFFLDWPNHKIWQMKTWRA